MTGSTRARTHASSRSVSSVPLQATTRRLRDESSSTGDWCALRRFRVENGWRDRKGRGAGWGGRGARAVLRERGESGELWKDPEQTVENVKLIRHAEAQAAASELGAEFKALDMGDYPLQIGRDGARTDRRRDPRIRPRCRCDPHRPEIRLTRTTRLRLQRSTGRGAWPRAQGSRAPSGRCARPSCSCSSPTSPSCAASRPPHWWTYVGV